jgi:hypothetical protein
MKWAWLISLLVVLGVSVIIADGANEAANHTYERQRLMGHGVAIMWDIVTDNRGVEKHMGICVNSELWLQRNAGRSFSLEVDGIEVWRIGEKTP